MALATCSTRSSLLEAFIAHIDLLRMVGRDESWDFTLSHSCMHNGAHKREELYLRGTGIEGLPSSRRALLREENGHLWNWAFACIVWGRGGRREEAARSWLSHPPGWDT
ncbi:hypothetical protein GCM10009733_021550 [Nonomuraea maheshkhaliensis]|uniref:Uncharacterized protein n=1 Tax=Nonomuraea maheshkhaliensis TaxID=419590 RepID=A0ABN2F033_9ACTN